MMSFEYSCPSFQRSFTFIRKPCDRGLRGIGIDGGDKRPKSFCFRDRVAPRNPSCPALVVMSYLIDFRC